MKKVFIAALAMLVVGLLIAVVPIPAFADGSGAGIVGSPHDFTDDLSDEAGAVLELGSSGGWNTREEICRVCHVPHDHGRSTGISAGGLLWNHELSSATYTMYNASWSSSIDGAVSAQPDGIAKLCLGCHDGTVAIDSFDNKIPGTAGKEIGNIYGGALSGFEVPRLLDGTNEDLRATHPISIVYDPVADTNLNPTATAMGSSGTIGDVLDFGKVQCSSCHDVHDQESVAGTHLLRVTTKAPTPSALCLTCHIK